jgi:hypothetical protein
MNHNNVINTLIGITAISTINRLARASVIDGRASSITLTIIRHIALSNRVNNGLT